MDKEVHGRLLEQAMTKQRVGRKAVAEVVGKSTRTVTNWTSGYTMPTLHERELLRGMLGPYDAEGDAVEVAVRQSSLVKWRQDAVISTYERHLYDQGREEVTG